MTPTEILSMTYENLDKVILDSIDSGLRDPVIDTNVRHAARIAAPRCDLYALVGRRLQILRRKGYIEHMAKAQAPGGWAGWYRK